MTGIEFNGESCGGRKDGAGDGIRTRDINLGKVALYQLSYSRSRAELIVWHEREPLAMSGKAREPLKKPAQTANSPSRHIIDPIPLNGFVATEATANSLPNFSVLLSLVLTTNGES